MMCGPNLYAFSSAFVMIEAQLRFIVSAIRKVQKSNLASIRVAPAVHQNYNLALQSALKTPSGTVAAAVTF